MARLSRGKTQHVESSARGRIVNNSILRAGGKRRLIKFSGSQIQCGLRALTAAPRSNLTK